MTATRTQQTIFSFIMGHVLGFGISALRLRARSFAVITCALLLGTGCGSDNEDRSTGKDAAVVKEAEASGLTLQLSAGAGEIVVGERTTVRIDIVADDGIIVTPDSYENALRESEHRYDFRLIGSSRDEAVPAGDGSLSWRYAFDLEFVLPESYSLPPATISYVDTRETNTADPVPIHLETEPLTVVVRESADQPLSTEEMGQVATPAPVELPIDWRAWWWVLPAGAVVIAAVILLLRRHRRVHPILKPVTPAHEWAQRELAALAAEGLIDRGLIQAFHYRISDIVRGYVERRFTVAAPEMTTEEFLAEAARDGRFGLDVTNELKKFLEACDMVKYARVEPGPDGPTELMHTAIGFVERTRAPIVPASGLRHAEEHAA